MKKLLRSDAVQAILGWLLGTYIRVILSTVRWRHVNAECIASVSASEAGALVLFWHGRVPLCLAMLPQWRHKRLKALISPSADGEFIARALATICEAIRVSSAKAGDAGKARLAVAAMREAITWVARGGALIVTPDGPRGPNEIIAAGSLQIAKRSMQPVFLMGVAADPAVQLSTWDKVMFAAPFGRGAVVWDGPLYVPADADEATIGVLVGHWSARLSAATRRAEALVGRTPH